MRVWQAFLLALTVGVGADLMELQHRESRDSYLDAYQQSHSPQKVETTPDPSPSTYPSHPTYPVYGAPMPTYGPSKEESDTKGSMWYGVPHFHHHYTMPEPPPAPAEEGESSGGHGGFELTTILKFLAKLIFFKLIVKKVLLMMVLLILPKIKLLEWLWAKKKETIKPSSSMAASSEEMNNQLEDEDDDDEEISFFRFLRSKKSMGYLLDKVTRAIEKHEGLNRI